MIISLDLSTDARALPSSTAQAARDLATDMQAIQPLDAPAFLCQRLGDPRNARLE